MTKIALHRIMSPWKRFDYFYKFTNEYQQQKEALKKIDAFYEEIISNKRKIAAMNSVKQEKEESKQDFLDQLLQHQENDNTFSDRDIKDEVNTFLFGGHDATSAGLSFILYTLARHPEVQEKILEEQEALFGSLKNEPLTTYAHLQEMKYLEAVINEGLRLYPPAPIVARRLTNDIKLVHHNPKYFPDPEKFLPERFLKDEILPYTHLPFSAGTRNCIGKKFAMLQMKSCISKIIRHFRLMPSVPEYKLELVPEIILKSKSGIRISLQKRKR
nr:unnamed protein product [Callosobruchus chinensis]